MSLLLHWLLVALGLILVSKIVPGIYIASFGIALLAAFVMGLVNLLIRPVISFLTLPVNLLTFGLFSFVVNALMFALVAWLVPGFAVASFLSAILGSLLLALISALAGTFLPNLRRRAL